MGIIKSSGFKSAGKMSKTIKKYCDTNPASIYKNYKTNYSNYSTVYSNNSTSSVDIMGFDTTLSASNGSDFSITEHSDKDNVNINQLRSIIRDSKNDFTNEVETEVKEYINNILISDYNVGLENINDYTNKIYNIFLNCYNVDSLYDAVVDGNLPEIDKNKFNDLLDNYSLPILGDELYDKLSSYQKNYVDPLSIYYSYVEGKKLNELFNSKDYQGYIIEKFNLDLKNPYDVNKYNRLCNLFSKNLNDSKYSISDDLKNSKVLEIVNENGYDAIVLELSNGNCAIVNSCTNGSEEEDIAAIMGNIAELACEDEFSKELFNILCNSLNYESNDVKYYSNNQIKSCEKTIKKYIDSGKTMELYGYSLGGGVMEATYSRLLVEGDTKYLDKINSVCVYNPFTLLAETDNQGSMDLLIKDEKYFRYCAEGDVVSTFNHYVKDLDDKTVYLKAAPINSDEWFKTHSKACKATDLFTGGNHAFAAINGYSDSSFNSNGNITISSQGSYVSISNVIRALEESNFQDDNASHLNYNEYLEENNSYDLDECMKKSFKSFLLNIISNNKKIKTFYEDDAFKGIIDDFALYCADNFGNIKYTSENGEQCFGTLLGEFCANFMYNESTKTYPVCILPGSFYIDTKDFKDSVKKNIANNKDLVLQILDYGLSGSNRSARNQAIDKLINSISSDYYDNLWFGEFIDIPVRNKVFSVIKKTIISKFDSLNSKANYNQNSTSSPDQPIGGGLVNPDYKPNNSTTTTTVAYNSDNVVNNSTEDTQYEQPIGGGLVNPDYKPDNTTTTTTIAK